MRRWFWVVVLVACGRTAQPPSNQDQGGSGGADVSPAGGAGEGGRTMRVEATCTFPERKSGFIDCNEGFVHRVEAPQCEISAGGEAAEGGGGAGPLDQRELPRTSGGPGCYENPHICEQFQWGHCTSDEGSVCESGCEVDADCGPSAICVCSGPSPTGGDCWKALCRTDADCPGSLCASAFGFGLACLSERDECITNDQCGDRACSWDEAAQARRCEP